jgi:hypothetical protein
MKRNLKYIQFGFNDETQEVVITTIDKESGMISGSVVLNKTYVFSTIRFLISVNQRMTRGFSRFIKNKK